MHISFLGAADTVTGSKHLVELGGRRILLDCGLFQGYKALRERNWAALPVPPSSIDAVVLSHAHLDHCGWLPALIAQGFAGTVHASAATRDLAEVMLLDSAHLQEEDARRATAAAGRATARPGRCTTWQQPVARSIASCRFPPSAASRSARSSSR